MRIAQIDSVRDRLAHVRSVWTWTLTTCVVVTMAASMATSAPAFAQASSQPAKPKPAAGAAVQATPAKADATAGPVLTMETAKGTIVIQLYPKDAPKSVEHIVALVKSGFYRSQRIIRVVPGQLVQFGDKQSRDFTRREWWGRGAESGSGNPIGVAETSKTRTFKVGTVGIAHPEPGGPEQGDSQLFFALKATPQWTGKYTIIGQVTSGLDVLPKLKVEDMIKNITLTGGS